MSYTDHLSTLFLISFFKHMIKKSNQRCHWNRHHSSNKRQREIIIFCCCCTNTMIRLCCYICPINLFILSIIWSNTISTGLVATTSKKVSLFFIEFLFYESTDFIILNNIKLLYKSFWPFIHIIHYLSFQTYD